MATHSSVLAWRIPWTEEPGLAGCRPQVGHRVSHDWSDLAGKHARMIIHTHTHTYSNAVLPILFTENVMNLREYKIC